jgi:hypothetical protein
MRGNVRDARTARSGLSKVEPMPGAAAFFHEESQVIWPSLLPQQPTYPHIFAYIPRSYEVIYPPGTGGRGWDG